MSFTLHNKRVWVAGHRGMVGRAIVRRLASEDCEILTIGRDELDLKDQAATRSWIEDRKPDAVIVAAAKVGGILANSRFPADFLYDNLVIETNVIEGSFRAGVSKLLFLGSSCIFPKFAPQPIVEEALLTGALEPTNQWYAIAKIAGIKLCQAFRQQHGADFISGMPTNLYGPWDNFDIESSHVLPALIRKFDDAKRSGADSVTLWGTGTPRREFLHVDDCAEACLFLLKSYSGDQFVNIGSGSDVTISELASLIRDVTGFTGSVEYDASRPDGTPRKLMSSARINSMGWTPRISLREGIEQTYRWYLENVNALAA
ncbi:GDP-L-fucose synthase [Sphingobium quisquiliarum P25]|uniref:GDP-L-fucose synthase n=1 Tax=Sphingobium quisquiliarum P25 TaxID=1329909 RepID=T0GX06_9SPHN|nr:GDP-L-fucose synthase [Sphingobium quisquiliarum]EQB04463.1 GDP-L-fucose synthase [Sphingobium quisquiliarum P25]